MLAFYLSVIETPGDRSFFSEIYTAYRLPMLRYAALLLGDEGDAEDVVHDVFLAVVKTGVNRLRGIASDDERRAYLLVAVRNRCRTFLRKKPSGRLILSPEADRYAEGRQDADAQNEEATVELIADAIRSLGETYADVLFYALVQDMPARAIASLLGLTPATVRKRISRGKDLLRKKLEGETQE